MSYSREEKAGLRFLKSVLKNMGYPKETTIDQIFFRKDGDKVIPALTGGSPTVGDILEADILTTNEDAEIAFAGAEANAMWDNADEDTIFFINSPDGNGRIEVNKDGIKPPMIDGRPILSTDIKTLNQTKELLSDLLATFQEGENGEYTAVKADLANTEINSRLMQKDENGNYKPLDMDTSKFSSEYMQERLQAVADISKIIKGNNLYISDDNGTISKVEMTPNGIPYRGEYDRASVRAFLEKDRPQYPDLHGSVAMFFMKLLNSIGIHWFNDQITAQEEVETLREEAELKLLQDVDDYAAKRSKEVQGIKIEHTKDIGKDALLSPTWHVYDEMAKALVDPDSPEGQKLDNLAGRAYTYTLMGMFAGALSLEEEADKVMKLLDSFTSGKPAWEDPEMKNFLQRGFAKYEAAMKAFEGTKDAFDAEPMKELLGNAVNKMAVYAGNLVPLDKRAVMLTQMAKNFIDYSNEVPALNGAFKNHAENIRGFFVLGKLVEDGLKAQYNLANMRTSPKNMQKDAGDYLAYKTAEQIVSVDRAYNQLQIENTNPNAPTFPQLLSKFGVTAFQNVFVKSDFGKSALDTVDMGDARVFANIARDGYLNGNNAEIVKIARENARALAKMYTKANSPSDEPKRDALDMEKATSKELVVKTFQN